MSVLHQWVGLVEWFSWLLATWVSISNTHIITLRLWIYIPALALLWSPSMWVLPRFWEWRLSRFMRSLSGLLGLIGALLSLWWRILLDVLVSISCIFFTWTIGAGLGVEDDRLMSTCARSLICMVDFGWVRLAVSCISLAAVGCCLLNFLISVFWILWEWRNPTMCYDDVCLLPGWCSWCSNKIFFFLWLMRTVLVTLQVFRQRGKRVTVIMLVIESLCSLIHRILFNLFCFSESISYKLISYILTGWL